MEQQNSAIKAVGVEEARRITYLGRNTFYGLLHSGKIRAVRVGRKWLIPISSIDEYLQQK